MQPAANFFVSALHIRPVEAVLVVSECARIFWPDSVKKKITIKNSRLSLLITKMLSGCRRIFCPFFHCFTAVYGRGSASSDSRVGCPLTADSKVRSLKPCACLIFLQCLCQPGCWKSHLDIDQLSSLIYFGIVSVYPS